MILSAQEFGQLMREIAKCEWFKEWLDNYVKEIVDQKISDYDVEHHREYEHKEKAVFVEEILAEKEA